MKRIIVGLILTISLSPAVAQKLNFDSLVNIAVSNRGKMKPALTSNRDSLFKLLPSIGSDSARIRLIYEMIYNGMDFSRDQLTYHYKILQWAKINHDKVSEAVIMAEIGYNFYRNGDDTEGLHMLFEALKLAEQSGNKQAIGIVYQTLGICYAYNSRLNKMYMFKALAFSEAANDRLYVINAMQSLGQMYYAQNKPDSGRYYFFKALELCTRMHEPVYTCATLAYIASSEKNDAQALKYLRARAIIAASSQVSGTISHAYDGLSQYFLSHNQRDSGLFYARRAYGYSVNLSLDSKIRPVRLLSVLYDGRNADSALKYTKLYNILHDSTNNIAKMQNAQALAFQDQQRRQEAIQQKKADQVTQRLYILVVAVAFLLVLSLIFWRNYRQNKKAKIQIQHTLDELKATQNQLIQSEKMASLGELTAGIAHEIQNPLNFVNNFSDVNCEMIDELVQEANSGNMDEVLAIAADLKNNEEKINHHGKRADGIVKSMLQHSRAGSGTKEPTDMNKLADEYLRLAYHGLRAKNKDFNADLITHLDEHLPKIMAIPQDMGRVLLNLFNNAFYAVNEKQKTAGAGYKPMVQVSTLVDNDVLVVKVKDNGDGIPASIKDKIMQPFFTTKPTGEGTGLGLSLSYDIVVKGHGGKLYADTKEGSYSEFTLNLPIN